MPGITKVIEDALWVQLPRVRFLPLTKIAEINLEKLPVMLTWVPDSLEVAPIEEMVSGCTGSGMGG